MVIRGRVLARHGFRGGGSDLFEALNTFLSTCFIKQTEVAFGYWLPLLLCQIFQLSFQLRLRQHAGFAAPWLPRERWKRRSIEHGNHGLTWPRRMEMKLLVQLTISSQILGCGLVLR
jgi:hypothetical protein